MHQILMYPTFFRSNFQATMTTLFGNHKCFVCLKVNMGGIVDATFVGPRYSSTEIVRKYDSLARGWILGSVSEDLLVDVHNLGSAKAVWEKLKSMCDPTMCLQEDTSLKELHAKTEQDIEVVSTITNTLDQEAIPIEIILGKDRDSTETKTKNEDTQSRAIEMKDKKKLREFTIKGDWSKVKSVLKRDVGLATEAVNSDGSTILHIAVGRGHNFLVKKLLSYINDEQVLKKRDFDGSTALDIAAIVGNKQAANLLVKKNKMLLRIEDDKGEQPLHKAYEYMHLDTIGYLLKAVNDDNDIMLQYSKFVVDFLVSAISAKEYTLASELLQKFPELASKSDNVLMAIAKTFPSGDNPYIVLVSFIFFTGKQVRNHEFTYGFYFFC
ncbi:uncharacterized protein LOC143559443 [Bidens hawaiensis]|uniref:uncharacterized protein LOC143559443 n=1 Tax=Bidens hawaiensis TaxID=980011 RepID=UPI004049EA04